MTEEKFIRVVEQTANAAIAAGRDVNEVIHDTIEVLYERKNINELLPNGWIIANDCSECMYEYVSSDNEPCLRCYNKFFHVSDFHASDAGPYTNNFKPTEEEEQESTSDDLERDCVDCRFDSLNIDDHPCRSCYYKDEKPCFRPIDRSVPPLNGKEEK